MANAPTRPPNKRSERRALPEGPHVARKSEVDRTRKHLAIAAKVMLDQDPEVAETLQALRRPFGHRMLTVDRDAPRVPANFTNVAISVPEHLRTAIQDVAARRAEPDAAKRAAVKVQPLLAEAASVRLRQLLDGEVSAVEIPRDPRGSAVEKVNLNVPVDSAVLAEVREALPALGERLGFRAKATVAKLALRLLLDEYGLEYETVPNEFEGTTLLNLLVPPRLAQAIREHPAVVDTSLREIVSEGFQKVLAGLWKPYVIPKAAQGSEYERATLSVYVDSGLVARVREKALVLKEELGYRVTAQTIAIDYLISELSLEDLADAEYGTAGGSTTDD